MPFVPAHRRKRDPFAKAIRAPRIAPPTPRAEPLEPKPNPPTKVGGLYPTPTRVALLRQVANAQVLTDLTVDEFTVWLFPDAPTSWQDRVKVTARIRELDHAGWIAENSVGDWQLTDDGRTVLGGAS